MRVTSWGRVRDVALSALKVSCRVCGEPAFKWSDLVGFIHVSCVPMEWFKNKTKKVVVDPVTKVAMVVDDPDGADSTVREQYPPCPF
jgi:hypothetical protein